MQARAPRPFLLPLLLVLTGCTRAITPPLPPPRQDTAPPPPASTADATRPDAADHGPALATLLTLAFSETPLDPPEADRLLATIPTLRDPDLLRASLFALARRAPTTHLARLWTVTPLAHRDLVARGLAGRPRTHAPAEIPAAWFAEGTDRAPSVSLTTVVSRFRLPLAAAPEISPLLTAADPDLQLAGARLVGSPSVARPADTLLDVLPPNAIPPLARSLAARADTPLPTWVTLLRLTAARARVAPRLWGNAWRAVLDAVQPKRTELAAELQTLLPTVQNPAGLSALTLAWWNCDNAAVADTLTGLPALTLTCAPAGYEWVARTVQARVLGSRTTEPARRADGLLALRHAAQGNPQVLSAVATAATALPVSVAGRLVRQLASERDPGVMASLLEGLVDHPEHARALPTDLRDALLRAPFEQPEGPTLEARVQSLRLARALHAEPLLAEAARSQVRAVQLALAPDASVPVREEPAAPPPEPAVLRFRTTAGVFEIAIEPSSAPAAARQILAAAQQHRYDGLTFHRVVPGFVAQGCDPRGDGYGGTDVPVPTELSLQPFDRGAVGIPLAGLDTGGIQLFVVTLDAPHLDGRYPWVGRVRRGMEVVDGLLPGDRIDRVEVLPLP